MDENKCWFVWILIERSCKPIQLFFPQIARGGKRLFQGIENEPIRAWRGDKSNLFVFERPLGRFFAVKDLPESFAIVVITQSKVNGHSLRPYRLEDLRNGHIICFFTTIERAIASDE